MPDSVGSDTLSNHIASALSHHRSFPVRVRGFEKSPDHWLFLKVEDGGERFVELFEALYTGPLVPFRRADMVYVPHIGLGLFVKRDARYDMSAPPEAARL